MNLKVGDPDNGMIYIAVGTWTPEEYGISQGEQFGSAENPIAIDTRNPSSFFDPTSPAVIGYGQLPLTASYSEWQEFTIPLKYVATDRKPTISSSSARLPVGATISSEAPRACISRR